MENKVKIMNVIKFAGAFDAFLIGSGFATGQEIMQFFTSNGLLSFGAILISLAIFTFIGSTVMGVGYTNKSKEGFSAYNYFCGKHLGTFYEYFVPFFLFGITVIMISGAGATLNEYYGLNSYVGSLLMALMVLVTFLLGLDKLINIIGAIGPFIIVFTIFIGSTIVLQNTDAISSISTSVANVEMVSASSSWWMCGILYAAYNVFGSVIFFSTLGSGANTKKEAILGGALGSLLLMLAILIMNFALLVNIEDVFELSIPTLSLANSISPICGIIFSIVLICGIFSTAAPMFWTVCNKASKFLNKIKGTNIDKSKGLSFIIIILAFLCGLFPFDVLIGIIYPYTGYLGILFIICVIVKQLTSKDIKEDVSSEN